MSLLTEEFVIFDVETTGLSPHYGDRIVEIAALKVRGKDVLGRYQTLVNPQRDISYGAFQVNGISDAMVKNAPKAADIMQDIIEFIDGIPMIGHNVRFDLSFLQHEFHLTKQYPARHIIAIDTVRMARRLFPEIGKYSLSFLANALGAPQEQLHRAMADVELTHYVFCCLIERAREANMDSLTALTDQFGFIARPAAGINKS